MLATHFRGLWPLIPFICGSLVTESARSTPASARKWYPSHIPTTDMITFHIFSNPFITKMPILLPWVPEATRLLNPAGQRPVKRVWGPKWAKRAKGRTRVASGGEPQWSRYVWYRFCTWSLIGYSRTCFFQRPQLVRRGHVKWTGFFSKTEWCLVEKKCVQRRDFIEGENLYSVSSKFEKQ